MLHHMLERGEENPKDWLFAIHEILSKELFDRLVVSLWAIWGVRQKAIHESILQSPLATHMFIQFFIAELESIKNAPRTIRPTPVANVRLHQVWMPLRAGTFKINVDGGLSRDGSMGPSSIVCRDDKGLHLGSSTMVFPGINDPACLETLACREC